jgi:plasmid stabilization system protein ParE
MAQRFRFHRGAITDVSEARDWYAEQREDLASDFLAALDHAITAISDAPRRWPQYVARTRRYLLQRFPYSVVYIDRGDEVFIVAVAHQSRRPTYWRNRIRE